MTANPGSARIGTGLPMSVYNFEVSLDCSPQLLNLHHDSSIQKLISTPGVLVSAANSLYREEALLKSYYPTSENGDAKSVELCVAPIVQVCLDSDRAKELWHREECSPEFDLMLPGQEQILCNPWRHAMANCLAYLVVHDRSRLTKTFIAAKITINYTREFWFREDGYRDIPATVCIWTETDCYYQECLFKDFDERIEKFMPWRRLTFSNWNANYIISGRRLINYHTQKDIDIGKIWKHWCEINDMLDDIDDEQARLEAEAEDNRLAQEEAWNATMEEDRAFQEIKRKAQEAIEDYEQAERKRRRKH